MVDLNIENIQQGVANARATYGGSLANSVAMVAAFHPITLTRVLIQVGFEPIAPEPSHTWWPRRKPVWVYPNAFKYMGHIKSVDGYAGLFRGLGPRIVHEVINKTVGHVIAEKLKEEEEDVIDKRSISRFVKETTNIAVAKTAGYVLAYPFHLISIRMMVQFVGQETLYSSVYSSIREIYAEDGIMGFFKGMIPGLVSELLMVWMFRMLNYVASNYLVTNDLSEIEDIKVYSNGISNYIASAVAYPFQLVTNIMCVNDVEGLRVGNPPFVPIYSSWTECWTELGKEGRNRGSSIFWRTVPRIQV